MNYLPQQEIFFSIILECSLMILMQDYTWVEKWIDTYLHN